MLLAYISAFLVVVSALYEANIVLETKGEGMFFLFFEARGGCLNIAEIKGVGSEKLRTPPVVYLEDITRRREDINFIFECYKQCFTNERSE